MLQLSEFVWALRSSVYVVFNNFLLIDATDRSKISSDQKRLFLALRLCPLSFFANTPFKSVLNALLYTCFILCTKASQTLYSLSQGFNLIYSTNGSTSN